MVVLGQQQWRMLLTDKDHLCHLKTCNVSAVRDMGILLPIVLRNSALIVRKRVTLLKNVISILRIVRLKHFKPLLIYLQQKIMLHMLLLQVLSPLLHLQQEIIVHQK